MTQQHRPTPTPEARSVCRRRRHLRQNIHRTRMQCRLRRKAELRLYPAAREAEEAGLQVEAPVRDLPAVVVRPVGEVLVPEQVDRAARRLEVRPEQVRVDLAEQERGHRRVPEQRPEVRRVPEPVDRLVRPPAVRRRRRQAVLQKAEAQPERAEQRAGRLRLASRLSSARTAPVFPELERAVQAAPRASERMVHRVRRGPLAGLPPARNAITDGNGNG